MLAQWLAWRTQIPSIIALLLAGLLLGPVTGIVDPDELLGGTLFPLVSLAVAVILFEGGLDLPPRELRSTGIVVRRLITVGAVTTFLVAWFSAREIFGISNQTAMVLGAVLVVTGPTVVGTAAPIRPTHRHDRSDPARRRCPDRSDRSHRCVARVRDRGDRRPRRGRVEVDRCPPAHDRGGSRSRARGSDRSGHGVATLPHPRSARRPGHVRLRRRVVRRRQRGPGGSRTPRRHRARDLSRPT